MKRSRLSNQGRSRRQLRLPSLYSRTDEIKAKKSHRWVYYVLFIVSIFVVSYLVLFSSIFKVDRVVFSTTKFVNRGELQKVIDNNNNIFNDNIITFGLFDLNGRLGEVTGVYNVSFSRVSLHEMRVVIAEKAPLFVWQYLDKKVLVDENGYAWANYEDKYASLPVVIDTKNIPVQLGSKIVPRSFCLFYSDLTQGFQASTGSNITKLEVLDIISDLKVTSGAGWYAYFDTTRSAKGELINLARVQNETKTKGYKLEYVDLRIDNRIFYK